jgi:hypothetical protein
MSVMLQPGRLRHEMARRGWDAIDFAREARLSPATISAALAGRPISARSLGLMAQALIRVPGVDIIDSLIVTKQDREVG